MEAHSRSHCRPQAGICRIRARPDTEPGGSALAQVTDIAQDDQVVELVGRTVRGFRSANDRRGVGRNRADGFGDGVYDCGHATRYGTLLIDRGMTVGLYDPVPDVAQQA